MLRICTQPTWQLQRGVNMLRICTPQAKRQGVNMLRIFTQPARQLPRGVNMLRIFLPLFSILGGQHLPDCHEK